MIARNELGANRCKKLDEMIAVMPESEVNYENPYEMAAWADDIKIKQSFKLLDGWHFYDQPFCDGIDPSKIKLVLDPKFNVVNTVVSSRSHRPRATVDRGPEDSYAYI